MARFGSLDTQYFDAAGEPLVSGKIYFYESGTTTPKNTYADINQSIPNTNPVILTAAGRQPNIFFDGVAKAVLTDQGDVQIVSRDPVGDTATDFGDQWVSTKIYSANNVVIGSDGVYYRSLVNGNQNNNPVSTTGFWDLLYSVQWNEGITYKEGSVVTQDGSQYQSLQNSNLNNPPNTSPTFWTLLSFAWISTADYDLNQNAVGSDGILYTSQQSSNVNHDPSNAANRPTWWVGTSADAAASAAAAAASATASASSATDSANSATASANSATASANSATASASSATDSANSATASANSATASATSASESATSAAAALVSEGNAATSAAEAVDTLEEFEDIYLGEKASDPTVDNQGQALQVGALYFNTTTDILRIYNGTAWQNSADIVTSVSWSQITDAPDYNGQATKYLKSTGAAMSWETVPDEIPDQSGQNGNVLTTNGTVLIWSPPSPDELPLQVGNAGKYLTTDGTTPSWQAVDSFSEPKAYFFSGF